MLVLLADAHAAAGLPAAALPYALTARLHAKQSNADLLVQPQLARNGHRCGSAGGFAALCSARHALA